MEVIDPLMGKQMLKRQLGVGERLHLPPVREPMSAEGRSTWTEYRTRLSLWSASLGLLGAYRGHGPYCLPKIGAGLPASVVCPNSDDRNM